jgi:transposase
MLNGILWVLRTGAPWRDLPERYGPWQTVYSRFRLWKRTGVFDQVLARVQEIAHAEGRLDWDIHHVDGTVIRAHQHAAGGKKGDPGAEALGWSRGGFYTKVHIRCDNRGQPIVVLLTPGQQHESTMFEALMEQGQVKRQGPGRPRWRPRRLMGDKG